MPPAIPQQIVLLIHGIRTSADWTRMVKAILEEIPGRKVTTLRYGYFDLLRFWWPLGTRRTPVRRLARLIQIVRAEHPTEEIDVIAHSFGTYALARILHENRHVRLNKIILCGSVIAEGFRWEDVAGQITAPVLNECGTLDVWPVMASVTTAGFGATGTLGFGDPAVEDRYHKVAHSGCFDRPFVEKSWLPFLDTGVVCQSEAPDNYPRIRWWMSMLSSSLARYIVGAIMLVGLFTIPYRMSYYSRADPVGRALASLGYQRMIPGNTGWVWLGRYRTDERRWIEGPYFLVDKDAFLPRVPPQDGTIIVLERSSRIMVHGWQRGGENVDHLETICYEYDENADDTGRRLPPGARVIVRAAPPNCTFGDGEIAVWARVAYP